MKLFAYYALHTFLNQLKKLFKTWMLVFFLVCGLVGGAVGYSVAVLSDAAESQTPEESVSAEEPGFLERTGLSGQEMGELAMGALVMGILVFSVVSADKNGSKIFQPADVPLLFAAPLKPQTVLMFRLATQMGIFLVMLVYVPNLIINFHLGFWEAVGVLLSFVSAILVGKFLQVLLYIICSTNRRWKPLIRKVLYAILTVLALCFLLYWKRSEADSILQAAVRFFNAPVTRYIPIWGWMKGITVFFLTGEYGKAVLCIALTAAMGVVLCRVIWGLNADFYEDAMAKTEEMAEILAKAQSEKSSGVAAARTRKVDRSDKLLRDGLNRGSGAMMFFHKSLYNRFRFSHFGFFTKTMETYLVTACLVAAYCRFSDHTAGSVVVGLVLSGFVFFRAMGNPLVEDTQMDFFRLIPESTWSKLFWSALAGAVNSVLDLLLPMLAASAILWVSPLRVLIWLPFAMSVDFYSTAVGSFIDLSVPVSGGKMLKQIVQIMFLYFGILPDAGLIAVGFVFRHSVPAVLGAAALNLLLGILFLSLGAAFLNPKGGKPVPEEKTLTDGERRKACSCFSRIGFSVFAFLAVTACSQLLLSWGLQAFAPEILAKEGMLWILTFVPQYLFGMPVCLYMLRKLPVSSGIKEKVTLGKSVITVLICLFFMYTGNLVGTAVNALITVLTGAEVTNPLETFVATDSIWVRILCMVILAPLTEEYVFRKQLIDRMRVYGGKVAVVTSAMIFGLFHGNFSQMFYAFALGCAFGYVYLHTGKLRYSIFLHMGINFLGSILAPALVINAGENLFASVWGIGLAAYLLVVIGGAVAGFALFLVYRKTFSFPKERMELPKKGRVFVVWGNPGMILLVLGCAALVAINIFGV